MTQVSDHSEEIEHRGYRIRVVSWNGRYAALTRRADGNEILGGVCEVTTDWLETADSAIAAAKAAIESGEAR